MNTEQHYITGFNAGFLMAEYEPILLYGLSPSLQPNNNYLEGLLDGKQQLEIEKSRSRLSELDQLRRKGLDKSKELGRE